MATAAPRPAALADGLYYLRRWLEEGVWQHIHHTLVLVDHERYGRKASPSAAILGGARQITGSTCARSAITYMSPPPNQKVDWV